MKLLKTLQLEKIRRSLLDDYIMCKGDYLYSFDLTTIIRIEKPEEFSDGIYSKKFLDHNPIKEENISEIDYPMIHHYFEITNSSDKIIVSYNSLKSVSKSMSKDETRLYLNGVYFDTSKNNLVSTNGYILSMSHLNSNQMEEGFIVPRQTIKKILSLAKKNDNLEISLSNCKRYAIFRISDTIKIAGKIIEREYLNYSNSIPNYLKVKTSIFTINPEKLNFSGIKNILSKNKLINISLIGELVIGKVGEYSYTIGSMISLPNKDPIIFSVNAEYLNTLIEENNTMEIDNNIANKFNPIIIKNESDYSLLMPLKY